MTIMLTWLERLETRLLTAARHSRSAWLIGLALLLTSPALAGGWQFDDYLHQQTLRSASAGTAAMDLFRFMDPASPNPAHHPTTLIENGQAPWWTYPQAKLAFWRPLTALTHWLDYRLWPHSAGLMHLHSLLWLALLIALTARLFYQVEKETGGGLAVAAVAATLYALNEAQGVPAGWLANRNALVGAVFSVAALLSYSAGRRWFCAGWLLLALLSAEGAVAVWGYLLTYTLVFERGPKRWLGLGPAAAVTLAWLAVYRWLGFGASGTLYADPFTAPGQFALAVLERAPILLFSTFLLPLAEGYNLLPWPGTLVAWLAAGLACGLFFRWAWPRWRGSKAVYFWGGGMLLSLGPACLILPANRLLLWVSLGSSVLLAQLLTGPKSGGRTALVVIHLLLAPLLLPVHSYGMALLGQLDPGIAALPSEPSFSQQTLVIISAPSAFYPALIPYRRAELDLPAPARVRLLSASPYGVKVTQLDEQSLRLEPNGGYWLGLDRVFRGRGQPLHPGDSVQLSDLRFTVETVRGPPFDVRPASVIVTFSAPLTDTRWRVVAW